jgi:hypothetical protein
VRERMREDFELAQMDARVSQNWRPFLIAGVTGFTPSDNVVSMRLEAARQRVEKALSSL